MLIEINNVCSCSVQLYINSKKKIIVAPKSTAIIENINCNNFIISVENAFGSSRKEGIYNICVKTTYGFKGDGETAHITLEREIAQHQPDISYDRIMILSPICTLESYEAADKEKVKKLYRRNRAFRIFFLDGLLFGTELVVLLIIFGIVIVYNFGIKSLIVYCPCAYLLLILFNWFSDWISNVLIEKTIRKPSERGVVREYLESDYITQCYSSSDVEGTFMEIKRETL